MTARLWFSGKQRAVEGGVLSHMTLVREGGRGGESIIKAKEEIAGVGWGGVAGYLLEAVSFVDRVGWDSLLYDHSSTRERDDYHTAHRTTDQRILGPLGADMLQQLQCSS